MRRVANVSPEGTDALRRVYPRPLGHDTAAGRAILTGRVVAIPGCLRGSGVRGRRDPRTSTGFRSVVAVPLIRDERPIGAITVGRLEPGPFSENADHAAADLRRPGRDRDRERTAVQGAGDADPGSHAIGRRAEGAGRSRSGGRLDARPRDRAPHDRLARDRARRHGRRRDLRVRRSATSSSICTRPSAIRPSSWTCFAPCRFERARARSGAWR